MRRKTHRARRSLHVEVMESRTLLSGAGDHVLILSVDGLHQADITDPGLAQDLANIRQVAAGGVTYANASTTSPSDSFPGTLAYLTGAGPGTTGVYYDDTYSRTLLPPGSRNTPGTETQYAENIDKNSALISGGGNFDASSIDPTQLPRDPSTGQPVYPNQFLKTNTIFDVAANAGLYTAFSDKHPAYQIADGNNPNAIKDFYAPEINSTTALLDPSTGHTVDANALLAADPFTDVSKYVLVDASTDPDGPSDPHLINDTTHNVLLTEAYDDLKVNAILREIAGQASHSSPDITHPQVPNLFGMNFQAVSVAEKYYLGGVSLLPNGQEGAPSAILQAAVQHTDANVGKIVSALKAANLWNSTMMVLLAKHGQAPRVGHGGLMADSTLPNLLSGAGAPVAFAVQDDVSLLYLQDQSKTATAVATLQDFKNTGTIDVFFQGVKQTLPASQVINQIIAGPDLVRRGLGNPASSPTTPDIIVTLKPGYIWVGNPLHYQFKNAEHGGFSADDTHVALIVGGGDVSQRSRGTVVDQPVKTTQVAVSSLLALDLNPFALDGVRAEHTQPLPGLDVTSAVGDGHGHHGGNGFFPPGLFHDPDGNGPFGDGFESDILHGNDAHTSRFNGLFSGGKADK